VTGGAVETVAEAPEHFEIGGLAPGPSEPKLRH
jgi:hypothetical protein